MTKFKEVWKGKHFTVRQEEVEIEPGIMATFEHVWRIDGTRTIAENAHGQILLTREYRFELQDYDWRLPGGKLDFVGEDIELAASRELAEETGVTAKKWKFLWTSSPDATIQFQRHFLHASDISQGDQALDIGEKIEPHWFDKDMALRMALDGQIGEEISALSLLRYFRAQN